MGLPFFPQPKLKSRLEEKVETKKLTVVTERVFKAEVWTRDKGHCRCCGRKVIKTIELVPERGEVHHIHGRVGDLRFESRAALLLCKTCHERVTGRVNDKLVIVPASKGVWWFCTTSAGERWMDARKPVRFEKAA